MEAILELKKEFPTWGAKKLRTVFVEAQRRGFDSFAKHGGNDSGPSWVGDESQAQAAHAGLS